MKKKIFAIICVLVCCFSVFGVFSMTNREPVAYADVSIPSYTFTGSYSTYFASSVRTTLSYTTQASGVNAGKITFGSSVNGSAYNFGNVSSSNLNIFCYFDNTAISRTNYFDFTFNTYRIGGDTTLDNVVTSPHIYWTQNGTPPYFFESLDSTLGYDRYFYFNQEYFNVSGTSYPIYDVKHHNVHDYDTLSDLQYMSIAQRHYYSSGSNSQRTWITYSGLGIFLPSGRLSMKPSDIFDSSLIGCTISYLSSGMLLDDISSYWNINLNNYSALSSNCRIMRYDYFNAAGVHFYYDNLCTALSSYGTSDLVFSNSEPVTYYFTTDFNTDAIYQQGVEEGKSIGSSSGYQRGYDSGYTNGKAVGYSQGYNEGVAVNDYSFYDLFGSVIDAPVHVLTGLFNFELLGVNLWTLFTGLFTLAFVLWILKLVLGGK